MQLKSFVACLSLLAGVTSAHAQSSPGFSYGQVPTAAQWNSYFASKQDALGFIPCSVNGCTMLGPLLTTPSTGSGAGLYIPPGLPPINPDNGAVWETSAGLFARIAGVTVQLGQSASLIFPATVAGTFNIGGIPWFSSSTTIGSSGTLAANNLMVGGGTGSPPSTFVLGGDCSLTIPAIICTKSNGVNFGAMAYVASPVPLVNGGTGQANAAAALTALTGSQTAGKYVRSDGTNSLLDFAFAQDVKGTATNSTAGAGYIGENPVSEVLVGSAVSLTTATAANITSIPLTGGDWDCSGNIAGNANAATVLTAFTGWISQTSATNPTTPNKGGKVSWVGSVTGTAPIVVIPDFNVLTAGATTVYLSVQATFTTNTLSGYGYLKCRRPR